MKKVKRIVVDIKEEDHKRIKMAASELGLTIREYVLKAIAKDMYERARVE